MCSPSTYMTPSVITGLIVGYIVFVVIFMCNQFRQGRGANYKYKIERKGYIMTKKYRCKISTPWMTKGDIYNDNYYKNHILIDNRLISPENYPDLFERVEEMSNDKKWAIVFERSLLIPPQRAGFFLDHLGYNADKAYEYIVEGKK